MNRNQRRRPDPSRPPARPPRKLVDIDWVAERLGVTVRHIRLLVAERRIPFIKWGHLLRFDPDDIEGWIDGVRMPPASGTPFSLS